VWRIEVQPGEEAQVDFGTGAPLIDDQGPASAHLVLPSGLKLFAQRLYRSGVAARYRDVYPLFGNAFRTLGGVPRTLNLDNLKAAVLKADGPIRKLNPKLAAFAAIMIRFFYLANQELQNIKESAKMG